MDKNPGESLKWLLLSAEQGNREAQLALGWAYASEEEGVPYQPEQAIFWMKLSDPNFVNDRLKEELQRLSPTQLDAIEKRVKEWKPVSYPQPTNESAACNDLVK